METERLSRSDLQKKILVEFYERGMVSTKKELSDLHVECARAVGLSETQVKVSIISMLYSMFEKQQGLQLSDTLIYRSLFQEQHTGWRLKRAREGAAD